MPSEIKPHEEASMIAIYYIGLDIHTEVIACCIKKLTEHLSGKEPYAVFDEGPGQDVTPQNHLNYLRGVGYLEQRGRLAK